MNTEIRIYINEQFKTAPKTKKALELKEELIANAEEKLADMLAQGHDEKDSVAVVIHSIGNVRELISDLLEFEDAQPYIAAEDTTMRKKFAIMKSISASLFALAAILFLFSFYIHDSYYLQGERGTFYFGLVTLLAGILFIVSVGMLTYANHMMPPYRRKQDDMVEEYKEWKSQSSRRKAVRGSISSIIWLITVIMYFLVSFTTYEWQITWLIFIAGACAEAIVTLLFNIRE
ncbi:MAG: hypothetical protein LBM69_05300 [Lachnospiraceae bacterium]|jgi:hypothetical protein|nr:hypothetical protein [Lachnospiraceae bacterium]